MNRLAYTLIALTLALSLAACQQSGATAVPQASAPLPADYDGALPALTQLLVGTFRLEEQPQAVTVEQTQQLALLWRGYRALMQSDATAPQELASLQAQLYEAMTAEQLAAIAALRLTNADLMATMAEQGVQGAPAAGELSDEQRARIEALRQAGASQGGSMGPGGGIGPGGGMGGGPAAGGMAIQGGPPPDMGAIGGAMPPDAQGATGAGTVRRALAPTALMDKLIALLESK